MSRTDTVIYLHQLDPQAALERLNRITGLQFNAWPQSLVPVVQSVPLVAESLSYVAWDARMRR
jgi:hypothetical protein